MLFQSIVAGFLEAAVGLQPVVESLERLGSQLVDALLGRWVHLDQPRFTQHTEMFGDLRLAELEPRGNLSHWARALAQEFDDSQPVWLSQGGQRRKHGLNIP